MFDEYRWWTRSELEYAGVVVVSASGLVIADKILEAARPSISEKQLQKLSAIEQLEYRRTISRKAKIGKPKRKR